MTAILLRSAPDELDELLAASPEIDVVHCFERCEDALAWAQENSFDLAFLSAEADGLRFAARLRERDTASFLVLCADTEQYMAEAFAAHVSAYLTRPIPAARLREELSYAARGRRGEILLTATCFGRFEVYGAQHEPLRFHRRKSKELLALLIDCHGAAITSKEICAMLWEDGTNEHSNMDYVRQLFVDLRRALQGVGAAEVLRSIGAGYALDIASVDCDYYRYLAGDPGVRFSGEYLSQYSWAETTCAYLLEKRT